MNNASALLKQAMFIYWQSVDLINFERGGEKRGKIRDCFLQKHRVTASGF